METKIENPYEGIEYHVFPNLYTAKVPTGRRRNRCVGIFATLQEAVAARREAIEIKMLTGYETR